MKKYPEDDLYNTVDVPPTQFYNKSGGKVTDYFNKYNGDFIVRCVEKDINESITTWRDENFKLHRIHGPAVMFNFLKSVYWFHGVKITTNEKEFFEFLEYKRIKDRLEKLEVFK